MRTNKKVEAVADLLEMVNPDFTLSERYMTAYNIVKILEDMPEDTVGEPS
jgi:hypothetical protein